MKRAVVSGSAIASPNTAEGILLTLPPTPVPEEPGGYLWSFLIVDTYINFTPGAAATGNLIIRVRRGITVGGALVGTALTIPCTAAQPISITNMSADALVQTTPPLVPGQQYVITIQQPGAATGPGTANYAVAHCTAN